MLGPLLAMSLAAAAAPKDTSADAPLGRRGWYLAATAGFLEGSAVSGSGDVKLRFSGQSPVGIGVALEGGLSLVPGLLAGLEVAATFPVEQAGVSGATAESTGSVSRAGAVATWFPAGRAFFLRAAAGLAQRVSHSFVVSSGLAELVEYTSAGAGVGAGAGFSVRLGDHLSAMFRLDLARAWYRTAPDGVNGSQWLGAFATLAWD